MEASQHSEIRAQRRVARKYRQLGYDVRENPQSNVLPDFLSGVSPDIVARSEFDNVIIEVKRHASLKGSNDLVSLAERVSTRPDWRLELVVPDEAHDAISVARDRNFEQISKRIGLAISVKLYDLAYAYLSEVLVEIARELALANGLKIGDISDKSLLVQLGFKGILPDSLLQGSLDALTARNGFIHTSDGAGAVSEDDVIRLTELCVKLNQLL